MAKLNVGSGFTQLRRNIFERIVKRDDERDRLASAIRSLRLSPHSKVLDVGCGYGKNLKLIRDMGFPVLGVEISSAIVARNRAAGLDCIGVNEFDSSSERYELILMSHVIEHLSPHELLPLMDKYLDRLEPNGHLIIATPLFSQSFFDDFDHVKPYQPRGIGMILCELDAQAQYRSRNRLELIDIWFRKRQYRRIFARDLYLPTRIPISALINLLLAILFNMSCGIVGRTDGWIGLYRKRG